MKSDKMPYLGLAAAALAVLALYFLNDPFQYASLRHDFALLTVLACLIPSFVYLRQNRSRRKPPPPIPFLPITGMFYAIYFGLPALISDEMIIFTEELPDRVVDKAVFFSFLGWISLLAAFYGTGPLFRRIKPLCIRWRQGPAKRYAFFLIIAGFAASAIMHHPALERFIQIGRIASSFIDIGVGMFLILAIRGAFSKFWKNIIFFIIIPAFVFRSLGTGSVGSFFMACVFLFMILWAYTRRLPWGLVICFSLAVVVFRGTVSDFREIVWYGDQDEKKNLSERALLFVSLVKKRFENEGLDALTTSSQVVSERTSQLLVFGRAVELTPSAIPYWGGRTYATLPSTFIPRFLWPNKPNKDLGQWFGHTYYFLHENDYGTSINLPQVVELYINFGPPGIFLGMFGLGVLYRFLYAKFNRDGVGDGGLIIAVSVFKSLLVIESDFSLIFGSMLQNLFVLYIVLSVIKAKGPGIAYYETGSSGPEPLNKQASEESGR